MASDLKLLGLFLIIPATQKKISSFQPKNEKYFPRWSNTVPVKAIIALGMTGAAVVAGITYYATPKYTRVGYQPTQPVSYNHEFHAGELGIDCRYCHTGVDKSSHANSRSSCLYVLPPKYQG